MDTLALISTGINKLTLCMLGIFFMLLLSSADF